MTDLIDTKRVLKQWEARFFKENGRKPNKVDIDNAPENIKETYSKYTKLRKGQSKPGLSTKGDNSDSNVPVEKDQNVRPMEKSNCDDDKMGEIVADVNVNNETDNNSSVEVWGSQFDRKKVIHDKTEGAAEKTDNKPSFLKNLGQKMYQQSMKLNKLKTTVPLGKPLWKKPDTPRPVKHLSMFSPDSIQSLEDTELKTKSETSECEISDEKPAAFGKLFQKAMLISKNKGQVLDDSGGSEGYMNRYTMKSKSKPSFLPGSYSGLLEKHRQNLVIEEEDVDENSDKITDKETKGADEDIDTDNVGGHSWNMSVSKLIQEDELEVKRNKARNLKAEKSGKKSTGKVNIKVVDKSSDKNAKQICISDKHEDSETAKSAASNERRNRIETEELDIVDDKKATVKDTEVVKQMDEFDIDANANSDNDSPVKARSGKYASRNICSKSNKRVKKLPSSDEDIVMDTNDQVSEDSDIESGSRKRKKASKSQTAAKKRKTIADNVTVNDEGGTVTSMPVRKPASSKPSSDGNFIRLNMKIKTYKRKGRHMTGPQHKRMMWKQKMQARSKSYGDACFKCGQSGHWANKCPNKAGQINNKYEKEPVNDEDFPSMQEAAMLAKGCRTEKTESSTKKSNVDNGGEDATKTVDIKDEMDEDLEIQSGIVRSRSVVNVAPPAMEPLVQCGDSETVPSTPSFVMKGLKKFGFENFRPGQEEAVMRILCGLSTLVVLSTGGGKSLCYQLPAYLYAQKSTCITLVISPLVSLMEDQVTGLPNGIRGVCLHTNMTASQRESVLNAVKSGHAQFLLVSPEAVAGGSMSLITSMSNLPPIAFVCIDEAHCLSEWSHNFRPSYLRLCKVLQEKLGVNCFLGLTATATASTAGDVARHLKISDFMKATVRGSPIPANLILSVSRDESREEALIGLLKGERFGKLDSIIIYCTRRDQTDKVATIIRTCMNVGAPPEKLIGKSRRNKLILEWDAESYHAGLTPAQRKRVQNAFMSGKLRVVVATVAFGMGLDKSNVRGVIHYNMPKSFESYVQEIGRAGRDGERADCHVFLDSEGNDLCELRRHTYANTVDYRTLKKLVLKVFPPCRCKDVHDRHLQAAKEIDFDEDFEMECMSERVGKQSSDTDEKNIVNNVQTTDLDHDCNASASAKTLTSSCEQNNGSVDISRCSLPSSNDQNSETSSCGHVTTVSSSGQSTVVPSSGQSTVVSSSGQNIPDSCNFSHHSKLTTENKTRLCPGHERALPIQQTVLDLDVKEEGISTLLCYLELHASDWLENMSNVYANCKIQCYGGPAQLQAIAKKCPPVAVAIAKARKEGKSFTNINSVDFSVVDISDTMGWDSGPVKKELKLLQWSCDSGVPKRTGVMVEFSDLAYHFRTPGDFTTEELDDILQFLHERIQRQEKSEIQNLSRLCKALKSVSHKNYYMCSEEADLSKNDKLKSILNEYFDKQDETDTLESFDADMLDEPVPDFSEGQLISDIRAFYNLYGQEHTLTGRAIARIFHGIASPCFPATTWGRVRRFWRSHLNVDFNTIMKIATRELIAFRL